MKQPSMPSRRRAIHSFAFAATAFATLGARASAQSRPTIRVATLLSDAAAEVFYAHELGLFANAGIEVQIQTMSNGAAVASAVASNAVDVGWTTPVSLAVAHQKGIPFLAIAPAALYTNAAPFSALFVTKDSPIRSAHDIEGKVLTANGLGTMTEYGPRTWIDKNGGDATQVKFIEMPFASMVDALIGGRIDAAEIATPSSRLRRPRLVCWPTRTAQFRAISCSVCGLREPRGCGNIKAVYDTH